MNQVFFEGKTHKKVVMMLSEPCCGETLWSIFDLESRGPGVGGSQANNEGWGTKLNLELNTIRIKFIIKSFLALNDWSLFYEYEQM